MLRLLTKMAVILVYFSLLAGCVFQPSYSSSIQQSRQQYIHEMQRAGGYFVQTGETILISLPNDKLFYPHSANFLPESQEILQPLANLLSTYQINLIKISGNTSNIACAPYAYALSEQQARKVASYLATQSLDSRLIYSKGYGADQPIASNNKRLGQKQNQRIDLQFRFITPNE